jgi:hypothetical protein
MAYIKNPGRARFLHIGFAYSSPVLPSTLEPVFGQAIDWMRYAVNCWIVYTTSDPEIWYKRLLMVLPEPKENHSIFICEIDLKERSGQFPENLWKWLDKAR